MVCSGPLLPHTGFLKVFSMLQVQILCFFFSFLLCNCCFFKHYLEQKHINADRKPDIFLIMEGKKSLKFLPIVFLCRMRESFRICFNWVSLAAFVEQDSCWENGIFLIFIDPGRGRSPPAALSLDRVISLQPGWKYQQQQDVVFVRGLFPVPGPYKYTGLHQMCCHPSSSGWPSRSLPLFPPLSHSFFSLSLFLLPLLSKLSSVTLSNEKQCSSLTRLLGVAFPGEKDKQDWESEQAEARRRDHRRIGTVGGTCDGFVFVLCSHNCRFAGCHSLKWAALTHPHWTRTESIRSSQVLMLITPAGKEGSPNSLSLRWPF